MSAYSIATRGLAGRKIPQGVLAAINTLLFGSGEQGAWYDPADLSTLFQDSAGTTPVTAVEQPVGLMLDKSGRGNHASQATSTKRPKYSRRVNLLTKTENFSDAAWAKVGGTFSGTKFTEDTAASSAHSLQQTSTAFAANSTITFKALVSAAGRDWCLLWDASNNRRAWFNLATGATSAVLGVLSSRITQVATGVYECEMVFTNPTASVSMRCGPSNGPGTAFYTGDGTSGINIFKTSLTLTTDAHLPYQRVNTATDYDADPNKFPAYLACDGIDDAMQTGNIDFTGTDKMTVWAGFVKTTDTGQQNLVELSANWSINSAFIIGATASPANPNTAFASRGSTGFSAVQITTSPGVPLVASAVGSISEDTCSIKINGVTATSVIDQGTGNYGNYPLHIGARSGASYFFNGRLYNLIVRGAQSSLSQIEATELYIKRKMRLP